MGGLRGHSLRRGGRILTDGLRSKRSKWHTIVPLGYLTSGIFYCSFDVYSVSRFPSSIKYVTSMKLTISYHAGQRGNFDDESPLAAYLFRRPFTSIIFHYATSATIHYSQ